MNLLVMASGLMQPVATTLFFPQYAEANATDPVLALVPPPRRPRLLAMPDNGGGYRFDIRLRGRPEEETPFFET